MLIECSDYTGSLLPDTLKESCNEVSLIFVNNVYNNNIWSIVKSDI